MGKLSWTNTNGVNKEKGILSCSHPLLQHAQIGTMPLLAQSLKRVFWLVFASAILYNELAPIKINQFSALSNNLDIQTVLWKLPLDSFCHDRVKLCTTEFPWLKSLTSRAMSKRLLCKGNPTDWSQAATLIRSCSLLARSKELTWFL